MSSKTKKILVSCLLPLFALFFAFAIAVSAMSAEGILANAALGDLVWEQTGSWTTAEDKSKITASANDADQLQTYALVPLSALTGESMAGKDYEVTTHLDVTELGDTSAGTKQYQTGIVAWYLDENNYMLVYASQWSDGAEPRICVMGKVNGNTGNIVGEAGWGGVESGVMNIQPNPHFGLKNEQMDNFDLSVRMERVLVSENSVTQMKVFVNDEQVYDVTLNKELSVTENTKVGLAARFVTVEFDKFEAKEYSFGINDMAWETTGNWAASQDGTSLVASANDADQMQTVAFLPLSSFTGGSSKDYEVTTHLDITELGDTSTGNKQYQAGIVAWYLDENNYMIVYASQWSDGAEPRVCVIGKVNGNTGNIVDEAGWGGIESGIMNEQPNPHFGLKNETLDNFDFTVRVERTFAWNNTVTVLKVLVNGNQVYTVTLNKELPVSEETKVGLAARFVSVAFNKFDAKEYLGEKGSWTVSGDKTSITAAADDSDRMQTVKLALIADLFGRALKKDYELKTHFDITALGDTSAGTKQFQAGIIAWYLDENNYINVSLSQWSDGAEPRVCIYGKVDGNEAIFGGATFSEGPLLNNPDSELGFLFGFRSAEHDNVDFSVQMLESDGMTVINVFVDDVKVHTVAIDALPQSEDIRVGLVARFVTAEFNKFEVEDLSGEVVVLPYTETELTEGEVTWKVNGLHSGEEWTIGANNEFVTMNADNVQDENSGRDRKIDKTYAVRPTTASTVFGVKLTATIEIIESYNNSGRCNKVGIIPIYIDADNYVAVKLSAWHEQQNTSCINITGRIGGSDLVNAGGSPWVESAQIAPSIRKDNSTIKLSVAVFADRMYVFIGDSEIPDFTYEYLTAPEGSVEVASFESETALTDAYIGYVGNLKNVKFSQFAASTYEVVSNEIGSGWSTANPFGWTVDETKETLTGDVSGESMALHETDERGGYVVSAEIDMTRSNVAAGTVGVLYKAGLVPFWRDEQNYIAVWVQQYGSDAGARLVAKGQINGANLNNANDYGFVENIWLDMFKPVSERTKFTMKCEVTAFAVNVYINDEYIFSLSSKTEIPLGDNEPSVSYGAIAENGEAVFSNFKVEDDSTIVSESVITITVKTVNGELVQDATVRSETAQFTNNGDGTYTLTVSVRTSVKVTIEKEGYDTRVFDFTSTDTYRPQINQVIEIAEKEEQIIPDFKDDELNTGLSGGAIAGIVIGCVAATAAIGVGTFFIVRKKKLKK